MRILWSILLVLILVPGWSLPPRRAVPLPELTITATPVALGATRVGALQFVRGYRLTSSDPAFGGYSAMLVDGDRFTLLSDGASVVSFMLDAAGRTGHARARDLALGSAQWDAETRDTESVTRDPATGQAWVGLETSNRIWRLSPGMARGQAFSAPPAMQAWPQNRGAEAMVRLRDGRFIVLAESDDWSDDSDARAGILFSRDPVEAPRRGFRFSYQPPLGYSPVDLAELPDGRLLILNRDFEWTSGFVAKLTIVDRAAIRPGRTVAGRVIANFAAPLLHDNFEGMAVVETPGGTMLWIVSDDNQSAFQQTLLLQFRLDLNAARRGPESSVTKSHIKGAGANR